MRYTPGTTTGRSGALALVLAVVVLGLAPAADAAAFRYWTYWQGDGTTWTFATAGPAASVPPDGAVEGWRFAVTTQSGSPSDTPSPEPVFAEICTGAPAGDGYKLVALVVDTGTDADAPPGQTRAASLSACVEVPSDATGYDVLRSATTVRTDKGLVCGISEYPADECAPVVDEAETGSLASDIAIPTAGDAKAGDTLASDTGSGSAGSAWPTIGVVAVLGGAVAAIAWRRRTRREQPSRTRETQAGEQP